MKKLLIILLSIQILSAQQNVLYYSLLSSVVSPPPPPTPPTPPPTAYNRVNAIVQDNSGNMWFGTYVGVLKFDGTNWTTYNTGNSGLLSDVVYGIAKDYLGNIWFSTINGINEYNGSWNSYASGTYFQSVGKVDNYMWFGLGKYLWMYRYDGSKFELYNTSELGSGVNSITNANYLIWCTTYNGIFSLTKSTDINNVVKQNYSSGGLASEQCFTIEIDNSGNVWVGTLDNYISVYNGSTWTQKGNTSFGCSNIRHIKKDASGNMWVATYGAGVYKTSDGGSTWTNYTTTDGLAYNEVRAIYQDVSGNMWFGTSGGISKFNGTTWVNYH